MRFFFAALLVAASASNLLAEASGGSLQIDELRNWSSELERKLVAIPSEYVVLQVWSPFCEPCSEEVGELNAVLQTVNQSRQRLTVLGIPVQSRAKEIRAFVERFKPLYEQWPPDREFKETFSKVSTVPWTVILGKERRILRQWSGKISSSELLAAVSHFDAAKKGRP